MTPFKLENRMGSTRNQALWLVQKSRQLGQNYISPEHIVLALFVTDSAVKAVIERSAPWSCSVTSLKHKGTPLPQRGSISSSIPVCAANLDPVQRDQVALHLICMLCENWAYVCRLGVTNGEKIIKAKAVERLKGDSEAAEQRKAVTVGIT